MTMPSTHTAGAPAEPDLRERLLGAVPVLRAFAHSLTGDDAHGDDLVQDTLVRAWTGLDGGARDGDATAWLLTILHRRFRAERRAGTDAAQPKRRPAEAATEPARFREALRRLPDAERAALILVGSRRFSEREAAGICGVAVGTLKSRVGRARIRLAAELAQPPARA